MKLGSVCLHCYKNTQRMDYLPQNPAIYKINLHISDFFCIFAPHFVYIARARPKFINHKRPTKMASIQDIHALEEKIYDAVH